MRDNSMSPWRAYPGASKITPVDTGGGRIFHEFGSVAVYPDSAKGALQRKAGIDGAAASEEPEMEAATETQEEAEPLESKRSRTEVACKAVKSMIRSTVSLCELAGEDSKKCEDACTKTRAHAGKLLTTCGLDMPKVDFKEHKTSGSACGSKADLGVGKPLPLTNAAEVVHHSGPYARCFFSEYEVFRTVEDKTYEQVGGQWGLIASTPAGTDDSPGPMLPGCLDAPNLYSYDSPGFPVTSVRELPVGGGVKVSKSATGVELRMNFLEGIAAKGPRVRVRTDNVKWNNILKLKWDGKNWTLQPGSAIALGHVKL